MTVHPPAVAAIVLGAGELVWFTIELLRGYFWQDDFVFFYLGITERLDADFLLRSYNGHIQPGTFLLSWLLARLAPLNHSVAVLIAVVLHGLAMVLCWRLLSRLFGPRWAVLVPFAVVAFSPITFVMSMWWAYALQLLPIEVALLGALNAQAAYLSQPTKWRAAQGLLFVALGFAFWEKAVLIQPALFGMSLVLADGRIAERLRSTVRRHWRLWLAHGTLFAGYTLIHLVFAPLEDSPAPTAAELLRLVRSMIGDGLLPAMFGGPWNGDWVGFAGLAPPPVAVLAITWTLAAAVVLVGLWRGGRRAMLAFGVLGGYLVVSVLLVGYTRLGPFGALIGTDPRYIADALPMAAVFAALAVLTPRVDHRCNPEPDHEPSYEPGHEVGYGRPARSWAGAVPVAIVAALVIGASVSIAAAVPHERHQAAREYVQNVRTAVELEPDLVLYDTAVPANEMLAGLFGEYAMVSDALAGLRLSIDQPTDDLRMLDQTGRPRPIGLVDEVSAVPGPVPGCGHPVGRTGAVRIRLTRTAEGPRRVVRLGYYTQRPSAGTVSTPTGHFAVRFDAALGHVFVVTDGPFHELLIRADDNVCVTDVLVGAPLPQSG